jgi:putative oxidoreductase
MATKWIMGTLRRFGEGSDRLARRLTFLGPTLARLTVGVVFVGTGWAKLHSIADVTEFFTTLHIPFPGVQARMVAGIEFLGGLSLLLGLGTRVVALPLAGTMAVAILTAKRADIDGLTTLLGFEEWSYLVFFVWMALAGAGPLSLDALWTRLRGRGGASAARPVTP